MSAAVVVPIPNITFSLNDASNSGLYVRNSRGAPKFSAPSDMQNDFDSRVAKIFATSQTINGTLPNSAMSANGGYLQDPHIHNIEVIGNSGIRIQWQGSNNLSLKVEMQPNGELHINDNSIQQTNHPFLVPHVNTYQAQLSEQLSDLLLVLNQMREFNNAQQAAQVELERLNTRSPSEEETNDKTIPYRSDPLAIGRNWLGGLGAILSVAALCTPFGIITLVLVLALIAIHIGTAIYFCNKFPDQKGLVLKMTAVSLFANLGMVLGAASAFFYVSNIIKGLFGLLVVVQGYLFIKQGLIGWLQQGNRMSDIANATNDDVYKRTARLKQTSGWLSAIEGSAWVVLGVAKAILSIVLLTVGVPDPTLIDKLEKIITLLTTVLFDMVFSISYSLMIYTGIRDLLRHKAFADEIKNALGDMSALSPLDKAKRYQMVLKILKSKLTNVSPGALRNPALLKAELMKNQNTLKELADGDFAGELKNIDVLIAALEEDISNLENNRALNGASQIAESFIQGLLEANERSLTIDKTNIFIGFIGLIGGFCINHFIPMIGGGSFDMAPFINSTGQSEIWQAVASLGDCMLWMWVNYLFWTMDVPYEMNSEEKRRLNALRDFISDYRQGQVHPAAQANSLRRRRAHSVSSNEENGEEQPLIPDVALVS